MNLKIEYLSDEELELLIEQVEQNDISEIPEWQGPVLRGRYETRIMSRLLGGVNLFDNNDRFQFFKGENGGLRNETKKVNFQHLYGLCCWVQQKCIWGS